MARSSGVRHIARKPRPCWVFFTDLDGTLLDNNTYSWNAAQPALALLKQQKLPLVMVSSKSQAELRVILRRLALHEPIIAENGSAIYFPSNYFPFPVPDARPAPSGWLKVELGVPYSRLVRELAACARRVRVPVRGYAQMSVQEVCDATGLSPSEARRAMAREYDEPFLILDCSAGAWSRLRTAIRQRGLSTTRGGRFFHILGRTSKGSAVRLLVRWFRRKFKGKVSTVGFGDSPNDISMLRAVDVPILVARSGGRYDVETLAAVRGLRRAGGVGPDGWNKAALKLLREGSQEQNCS
jgi:mannosyl-3-phosphoglycerate phosphatase